MCDLDLRRKCGYKPRSFSAFMGLPEEERAAACEMDTVIGLRSDRRCLLTLYLRAFRFQLALLMPCKTAEAVQARARSSSGSPMKAAKERAPPCAVGLGDSERDLGL